MKRLQLIRELQSQSVQALITSITNMAIKTTSREIQLGDHTTAVLETAGTGCPLILIHAAAMDKNFWNFGVLERLAVSSAGNSERQRRIIAYDLRGHGRASDAPITTSVDQLSEDLRQMCTALDLTEVDVGGISYGGVVAQQFVLDHPSLVRSALFIGTLLKGVPAAFEQRAATAEKEGMGAMYEPSMTRWFLPASLETNGREARYVRKQLETTKVSNWAAVWRTLAGFDFTERLQEVKVPALCQASKEDTSTPPDFLKKICGLVKNGTYVEVQGGMHFFPLEIPEATAESMTLFLDEMDRIR